MVDSISAAWSRRADLLHRRPVFHRPLKLLPGLRMDFALGDED
jgi:hypothetical protein